MITTTMDYKEISRAVEQDWKNELMDKAGTCFGMKLKYARYIMKNVGRDEFCFLGKRYLCNCPHTIMISTAMYCLLDNAGSVIPQHVSCIQKVSFL